MWREEHLWNVSVLSKITLLHSCNTIAPSSGRNPRTRPHDYILSCDENGLHVWMAPYIWNNIPCFCLLAVSSYVSCIMCQAKSPLIHYRFVPDPCLDCPWTFRTRFTLFRTESVPLPTFIELDTFCQWFMCVQGVDVTEFSLEELAMIALLLDENTKVISISTNGFMKHRNNECYFI